MNKLAFKYKVNIIIKLTFSTRPQDCLDVACKRSTLHTVLEYSMSQPSVRHINVHHFTIVVEFHKTWKLTYKSFDDTYRVSQILTELESQ